MDITPYSERCWPSLARFLARSYPQIPLKSDRRYFDWRFSASPLGSALGSYFLAMEGDQVVGQFCTMRDRLWTGRTWQDCYWGVDLLVAPEHRTGMLGMRLFQALMSTCPLVFSAGFTQKTSAFHRVLRWQWGPRLTGRFVAIRPGRLAALAGYTAHAALAPAVRLTDGTVRALQKARTCVYSQPVGSPVVEEVEAFDDRLDVFLEQALDWDVVQPYRSAAHFNWRFASRPLGGFLLLVARDPGAAEIRGYMVVRLSSRAGVARWADIADFVVRPDDAGAFRTLLHEVLRCAVSRGVDFIRMRYSSASQLPRGVRPPGVGWQRDTDNVAYYCNVPEVATELAQRPWALTAMVSDYVDSGADEWDSHGTQPAKEQQPGDVATPPEQSARC